MKNVLGIINLHENEELLKEITRYRTLAAVPFGGRFRLIDFILSNMVNSGIDSVGILTKHRFRALLDHLRSGKEWDLARKQDGLFILPPPDHIHYSNSIYKGDLEYFYNNLDFLTRSNREYVIIAGSHIICNLNFQEAFQFHLARQADITILYKREQPIPGRTFAMATALQLDEGGRVQDMEVSVGEIAAGNIGMEIFIMAKKTLIEIIHDCVARGQFDFTKEGIIRNIGRYKMYGFPIRGYMAKVNSVQSYYQASMDVLKPGIWGELFCEDNPIYTKVKDEAPANYRPHASISNALIANGCVIEGHVENSILFRGVRVGKGARIKNSIIMQNCELGTDVVMENVICDKQGIISRGKRFSGDPNYVTIIEKGMVV